MAKIILSPLFLLIFITLGVIIYLLIRIDKYRPKEKTAKTLLGFIFIVILIFGLFTMPIFSIKLASPLENPYALSSLLEPPGDIRAVTILSGGIYPGPETEFDLPGDATGQRVRRGVEYFLSSNADYLIMQGRLGEEPVGRMVELMKDQAVSLGVEEEKIILEFNSRNTREHPYYLKDLGILEKDDKLAVVSSAWHLRRTEQAFSYYYDDFEVVPAEFISYDLPGGLKNWFPSVTALRTSTRAIHEYIGMLWYHIIFNWFRIDP
ncbi:MAG: YdcF family protein [Bacillota bacterium]